MTLQFHFHLLHSKFRIMSYDFDLNELWTFYDFATKMILTVVILKVLNSLIHQSFSGENTKIK